MGVIRRLFRRFMPLPAPNLVTYDDLVRLGACSSQRRKFRQLFGDSGLVTAELAIKHRHDFDLRGAVLHLLTREGHCLWVITDRNYFERVLRNWNQPEYEEYI